MTESPRWRVPEFTRATWFRLLSFIALFALIGWVMIRGDRNMEAFCAEQYAAARSAADTARIDQKAYLVGTRGRPERTCRDFVARRPARRPPN
jgi:hypothetical protein